MSASAKHIGQFTPLGATTQALGDSMSGGWPHPAALAVPGLHRRLRGPGGPVLPLGVSVTSNQGTEAFFF